jgi:hypothetical protein
MRADIDKDGVLHIAAETGIESFALRQWAAMSLLSLEHGISAVNGNYLIVDLSLPQDKPWPT